MARTIAARKKRDVKVKLGKILEQYFREAEEHEDDDVIRDTNVEGRLNDFAMYLFNLRYKRV